MEDGLIGYEAAANMLGVKLGTLYAWVHQRRVPHLRLGPRAIRFDTNALRAWLEEKRIEPTNDVAS